MLLSALQGISLFPWENGLDDLLGLLQSSFLPTAGPWKLVRLQLWHEYSRGPNLDRSEHGASRLGVPPKHPWWKHLPTNSALDHSFSSQCCRREGRTREKSMTHPAPPGARDLTQDLKKMARVFKEQEWGTSVARSITLTAHVETQWCLSSWPASPRLRGWLQDFAQEMSSGSISTGLELFFHF